MKKLLLISCLLGNVPLFAQTVQPTAGKRIHQNKTNTKDTTIYRFTDVSATPPDGAQEFQKYLSQNISYPQAAIDSGISGRVYYQFVVGSDGSLHHFTILKDIGSGCGAEVLKALNSFPGKWIPAQNDGTPVPSYYTGTFKFDLKPKVEVNNPVYRFTDKSAEPPGGIYAFYRYLSEHTTYPVEARKAGVSGKVVYQFTVDTAGKISNIKILKGPGFGCNEAVKETLERYHTHWIPATNNGHPVEFYYTGAFNFSLK